MKLLFTYVPFQLLLGVVLGILFPCTQLFLIGTLLLFVLFLFVLLQRYVLRFVAIHHLLFLGIVFLGVNFSWLSQIWHNNLQDKKHYTHLSQKNICARLTLNKSLTSTKFYHRFYAEINMVNDTVCHGNILVEVSNRFPEKTNLQVGDVLVCKADIIPIRVAISPYDFDYKMYLARKDVYGKLRLTNNYIKTGESHQLLIELHKVRQSIILKLNNSCLSSVSKEILKAILLGDKRTVPKDLTTSFTKAGVVHIMAISGMHVGVLYLILLFVFGFVKKLKYGSFIYTVLVLIFLWSFAVFSGLSSSVIRAVTMFSFFSLAKLKASNGLMLEAIVSSMLFLLLYNPNFLYDAGFQLSYVAVIAIVIFYPLMLKNIVINNKAGKYLIDVLIISLIAQLGVFPLSVYYFHQFSLQFLIANFFAVSLLPVVLYAGVFVLISVLLDLKFVALESAYNWFIDAYLFVIRHISSFDHLIVKDIYFHKSYVFSYYVVLFFAGYLLYKHSVIKLILFICAIVFCELLLLTDGYLTDKKSEFLVYNTYKQTLITVKTHQHITVMGRNTLSSKDTFLLKSNQLKNNVIAINTLNQDVFSFHKKTYLIVHKNKPYHQLKHKGMVLIISNNPRVNFERLLQRLKPQKVIIDHSNYKSNWLKWKKTCKKLQVPFYNTKAQGAYQVVI